MKPFDTIDLLLQQTHGIIFDIDGVMTDGGLYYTKQGETLKRFHVHDGLGLQCLQRIGIRVGVISGRESATLKKRLQDLGIQDYAMGQHPKQAAFDHLLQRWDLNHNQVAYMGDDLNDLPLLEEALLAITVPCAPIMIQQRCIWTTHRKAGQGAVREVCDRLITAQNRWDDVLNQLNQSQQTITQ